MFGALDGSEKLLATMAYLVKDCIAHAGDPMIQHKAALANHDGPPA